MKKGMKFLALLTAATMCAATASPALAYTTYDVHDVEAITADSAGVNTKGEDLYNKILKDKVTSIAEYAGGTLMGTYALSYDANGKLAGTTFSGPTANNSDDLDYGFYDYDNAGNLLKKAFSSTSTYPSSPKAYTEYEYADGKVVKTTTVNGDSTTTATYIYGDGRKFGGDLGTFSYDANGNLEKYTAREKVSENEIESWKMDYTYDKDGNLLTEMKTNLKTGKAEYNVEYSYTFDSYSRLTEFKRVYKDGSMTTTQSYSLSYSGVPTPTPTPTPEPQPLVEPSFKDVPEKAYYAPAVAWAVDKKVTSGTSTTTFSPSRVCTRGEIVTFLYRLAGSPDVSDVKVGFTDVVDGAYYANAVKWAVKNGITSGKSAKTFASNDSCTRGEIVTFLYKYKGSPDTSGTAGFSDVTNQYFAKAVLWAKQSSITGGKTATTFAPYDRCTRAEAVSFLYRAAK